MDFHHLQRIWVIALAVIIGKNFLKPQRMSATDALKTSS